MFDDEPVAAFLGSFPITQAQDLLIVPTPGHALGHQSMVLRDGDRHYFFAGDASFDDVQLQRFRGLGRAVYESCSIPGFGQYLLDSRRGSGRIPECWPYFDRSSQRSCPPSRRDAFQSRRKQRRDTSLARMVGGNPLQLRSV